MVKIIKWRPFLTSRLLNLKKSIETLSRYHTHPLKVPAKTLCKTKVKRINLVKNKIGKEIFLT